MLRHGWVGILALVWAPCGCGDNEARPDAADAGDVGEDAADEVRDGDAGDEAEGDAQDVDVEEDGADVADGSDAPPAVAIPPLVDEQGRTVYYVGVNVCGTAKDPPDFLPGLADADLDRLVEWGVTLGRYLVLWEAIEPEQGVYDDAYLAAVRSDLDRLAARGVDVFLDMHQDVFGRGFGSDGAPAWACPAENYATFTWIDPWFMNYLAPEVIACFDWLWATPTMWDRYRDAWVHAATALADHPAVVGFDLMNEPSPGSQAEFDSLVLGPFYEHVAAGLATVAPGARFFLEPSFSFNLGIDTNLPPFGAGRIFAPHFYPLFAGDDAYTGDLSQVRAALAMHAASSVRLGAPLVLGEFGILNDATGADRYVADVVDATLSLGGSPVVWALSRGGLGRFALLDDAGEPHAFARPLARPYAHRVAGRLVSTSYDRASGSLEVTWDESGVSAPTELVVPPARFAALVVTSDDPAGSWTREDDAARGRVRLLVDHARARHTFRITTGP